MQSSLLFCWFSVCSSIQWFKKCRYIYKVVIRNRYDITALQETFWNLDFIDENKTKHWSVVLFTSWSERDRRGHDRMVEEFTTIYVISAYHH